MKNIKKVIKVKHNGVIYGVAVVKTENEKYYTAPGCGKHETPILALTEFLSRKKKVEVYKSLRGLQSSWKCKMETQRF